MNRRYNNYKQGNQMQQRSMFLPIMICSRSSLKDVKLSHSHRRNSDDPPSPKLRFSANQSKRNNKVSGFPLNSSSSATVIKSNHSETDKNIKYQKLRRLFSAKSLIDRSASTNTDSASLAKSEKAIDDCYLRNRSNYTCESRSKCGDADLELKPTKAINVEELDPPLPVVRRQLECGNGGEEKESLWKRRSRGGALMSLQVQSVHGGATISLHTTAAITV